MIDSKLELWRLVSDLSIEDAAILIAGGDPSDVDYIDDSFGNQHPVKRTEGHPGFIAVFTSLTNAVRKGRLSAHLAFRTDSSGPLSHRLGSKAWILSRSDFERLRETMENDPFAGTYLEGSDGIQVEVEPDWSRSTVDVDVLKSWLRSRGYETGFFFPVQATSSDDFMDDSHERFAPELALAVEAWRALADERKFKSSAKALVENWIEAHPEAWRGSEPLSASARERIAVVVNWQRSGGAPRSGS